MSKPYPEEVTESLRLHILRSLVELNHTANDSVLLNRADKFGFCFSRDRFRNELRWMERNGLIEFTKIEDSDCYRVKLHAYGDDVCHGRERLEGVQNPHAAEITMGKELPAETRYKAQELYCVVRLSLKAVAEEVGVAYTTVQRWAKTYDWRDMRERIAKAECEIKADTVLARSEMLKKLIQDKSPMSAFAVSSLESLAMKQAEAERAGKIIAAQLEAPIRKIETKADAVAALREAVERKLSAALQNPEGTDVLTLAKQVKEANALIESMAPKDDDPETKKGLSARLEAKIRDMI